VERNKISSCDNHIYDVNAKGEIGVEKRTIYLS
jgi:hypothetical protein